MIYWTSRRRSAPASDAAVKHNSCHTCQRPKLQPPSSHGSTYNTTVKRQMVMTMIHHKNSQQQQQPAFTAIIQVSLPSVLWRCWLGSRKGIRPIKNWVVGCWHGYLSGARCRLAYGLMPLSLTVSCFSKIQISFTFLVLAHLGSPGKRAVTRVCVCVQVSLR